MPELIGISGKIGVGKTITAEILRDAGLVDRVLAFGDPVKVEAAGRFNFDVRLCYEDKDQVILHQDLPGGAMSVRRILQWWGTDVRRREDPLYWVKRMGEWFAQMDPHERLVIHDVRFREEAFWIREAGGYLARIEPYPGWRPGPEANHQSEVDLDDWQDWDVGPIHPVYNGLWLVADTIATNLGLRVA